MLQVHEVGNATGSILSLNLICTNMNEMEKTLTIVTQDFVMLCQNVFFSYKMHS